MIASCIPEKPHQPNRGFDQCSQKKLSALFDTAVKTMAYSVASYIAESKRSFYGILMLIHAAFISIGFSNWKDAAKKFPIDEPTICHKEACLKVIILP